MGWGDIAQGAAMGGSTGAMFGGVGLPVGIAAGALLGILQGNAKDKKNAAINEARAVEMANSPWTGRPLTEQVNEMSDWGKTAQAVASAAGSMQAQEKAALDEAFRNKQLQTLGNQNSLMSSGNQGWSQLLMSEYDKYNNNRGMS